MSYAVYCRPLFNVSRAFSFFNISSRKSTLRFRLSRCMFSFYIDDKTNQYDFETLSFRRKSGLGPLRFIQDLHLYPKSIQVHPSFPKCTSANSTKLIFQSIPPRKIHKEEFMNVIGRGNGNKFRVTRQKLRETNRRVRQRIREIKENVMTIPNALCLIRIGATPVLGYLVLNGIYDTSLVIFLCAGVTDVLDGFIARNFPNQQSMIGSFLDPAADKLLIATLFLTLTAVELIPVPLTALIVARDVCLMGAGFYIRYKSLPPPKTLSRYFDVRFATAKLSPTVLSKANTGVQVSLAAFTLAAPVFGFVDHPYIEALWYLTACTTILSGGSYLFSKDTYKMLTSYKFKGK